VKSIIHQIAVVLMVIGAAQVAGTPVARADEGPPLVGFVEKLGTTVPLDVELYDEHGAVTRLGAIITKPTVLTFVYFRCPGICTPLLTEITTIVRKTDLELGKDYQIVTVSFDASETPEMAADKKENYMAEINRPADFGGWRFLTGDSASVARLAHAAGFYYQRSGRDWIHQAGVIVLSPTGKVTRYLYGVHQLPLDVKLAVMEAAEGKTGPTIAKVISFCFSYDPEGRHYAFNIVRVSGVLIVGLVALFVVLFVLRPRRLRAQEGRR
jgi:protein SCO1/2